MKTPRHFFVVTLLTVLFTSPAVAAPCLDVTLTGTQGGPPSFNGLAGSGTLVRFGDTENNCSDIALQFDAGRGTTQRLSQIPMPVGKINAVFLTHMHSDHVEGVAGMMQLRWHFNSKGPKVDLVCHADAKAKAGHTMSCEAFASSIGDNLIKSGEIGQRLAENPKRLPGGPADLLKVIPVKGSSTVTEVWRSGDVVVSAVASRHVAGHMSYRVDSPAGSVVIGGDAGNDKPAPPRDSSTSAQVEAMAKGADILVHSVIHPVMGPKGGTKFPPPIFFRQSTATDIGNMADRAGVPNVMLTHLIPPLGAKRQGPFVLPDGALDESDYESAVRADGYGGKVVVGTDLATIRLTGSE